MNSPQLEEYDYAYVTEDVTLEMLGIDHPVKEWVVWHQGEQVQIYELPVSPNTIAKVWKKLPGQDYADNEEIDVKWLTNVKPKSYFEIAKDDLSHAIGALEYAQKYLERGMTAEALDVINMALNALKKS